MSLKALVIYDIILFEHTQRARLRVGVDVDESIQSDKNSRGEESEKLCPQHEEITPKNGSE
eukprot:Nk52_evm45s212 gene=Nk52_evmTU45s212